MNELTTTGFQSLDAQATAALTFRERDAYVLVWETDEYGDRRQVKKPIDAGPEIFPKREISETLLKALTAPCSGKNLVVHLTRLKSHKNYCQGDEGWRVILQDLGHDLAGCSEYAVIKACEHFRQDPDLKFFPDTAVLQRRIRDLDFSLRNLRKTEMPKKDEPKQPDFTPDGLQKRVRVANLLHDAHIPHDKTLCERCKDGEKEVSGNIGGQAGG